MFEVPPKYRPPKREQPWPVYRHYSGARTSCDDCILAIASGELRWIAAPAAYSRTDEQGRRYLCHRHTQERRERETYEVEPERKNDGTAPDGGERTPPVL
jgi:hypothetical protein